MPVTVKQTRRSKSHTSSASPTAKREYMAWGSADGDAIEAAVNLIAPSTVNGLIFDSSDFAPHDDDETVWDCVYSYSKQGSSEQTGIGDEEISFNLGSQTVKVLQSYNTTRFAPAGKKAPDFKGGIGYDSEKKQFVGCDRLIEQFTFSITKNFAKATVESPPFIQNLRAAAFHTNDAQFRSFQPGEVHFVGAAGNKRSSSLYAITFNFAVGKNASNLQAGDVRVTTKKAWDYLWILYEEIEDTEAKFITPRPKAGYVEGLYDPISFPQYLQVPASA